LCKACASERAEKQTFFHLSERQQPESGTSGNNLRLILGKVVNNPKVALWYLCLTIKSILARKKGVLVYLGMHRGFGFFPIFRNYRACYCFEANPVLYEALKQRYGKYPQVHLFNLAVAAQDGQIRFNISSNDGESSSIGELDPDWYGAKLGQVKMVQTITVPCVNLLNFCKQHSIDYIDDYVSDIQGMDLEVLKTMRPFIEQKKIGSITCEVARNETGSAYQGLPDNSEKAFAELLDKNYKLVAKGWTILREGHFAAIPEGQWEMDCRWRAREPAR
jgi:FkbM family methyltransferase